MRVFLLNILRCITALWVVLHIVVPTGVSAREFLDIYSTGVIKFPVAVPGFEFLDPGKDSSGTGQMITEILSNDLKISGIFDVRSPGPNLDFFKAEKFGIHETIRYNQWISLLNVDGLVKAGYQFKTVSQTKSRRLAIDVYFYDLTTKTPVLGKRYESDMNEARRMAHRIGNDIVHKLTGERGIFDTKIAFSSKLEKSKHVFIIDFDGTDLRRITSSPSIDFSSVWSPDGKYLAYTCISPSEYSTKLYAQPVDGRDRQLISDFPGLNTSAAWSADGQKLAMVLTKDGNPEIYVKDRKGTLTRLTDNWSIDTEPSWSPDGKWIVFVSDRAGGPQLYIMDDKGRKARRLTFEGNYNTSPAWSPRGDKIAYTSLKDGKLDIYLINPDGTGSQALTNGPGRNESPSWSPDGRLIAFSSGRLGPSNIFIMEANGSNARRLTKSEGEFSDPAWSPRLDQ